MKNVKPLIVFFVFVMIIMGAMALEFKISNQTVEPKHVVLITKMRDGGYWETVVKGAEAAAEELNIKLTYDAPNEEDDVEGQIAMVERYIEAKVDAIVLAASDYEALVPVVEKAHGLGIKVNLIDAHVNTDAFYRSFSTDNYRAGQQAGEAIAELLEGQGTVGIVSFVKGSENAIAREQGLSDYLDRYDQIQVVDTKYCMSSVELAETHAMIYLDQHVDLIIGLNAIAANGVGLAIEHYGEAIGVGFDAAEHTILHLDKGYLDATIVQNPYGMGYLGVKYAVIEDQKNSEKEQSIETFVITTENLFDKENQKIVFPFDAN